MASTQRDQRWTLIVCIVQVKADAASFGYDCGSSYSRLSRYLQESYWKPSKAPLKEPDVSLPIVTSYFAAARRSSNRSSFAFTLDFRAWPYPTKRPKALAARSWNTGSYSSKNEIF